MRLFRHSRLSSPPGGGKALLPVVLPTMVLAGAGMLMLAAPAAAAVYVWQGDAVITGASNCGTAASDEFNYAPGTVLKSVLRPAGVGTNGNDARLSFIHNGTALFGMTLAGGLNLAGAGTYVASGFTVFDGTTTSAPLKTNVGGSYNGFALFPATATTATTFLSLTGTISKFMFVTPCTVSFRANYALRPD